MFWLFIYTTMCLGGQKTKTFENGFQSASTVYENNTVVMCKLH